jgi:ATP synthase I chain
VDSKHFIALEKWTALLALAVLAVGLVFLGRHAAYSIAVGAALMIANAWLIRRVAEKLGHVLPQKPGLTIALFNLKLGLLIALIWLFLRYLHVEPIAFIIGVSVLPLAIVMVALQNAREQQPRDDKETHG